MWKGIIREYPEFYRFHDDGLNIVTILEGNTPLIPAPRLAAKINPDIIDPLEIRGVESYFLF